MRQSSGIPQPSFLFTQSPVTLWCEVKGRSRWPRRPGGPGGKNQKSMLSLITPFKINLGKGTLSATHVESATFVNWILHVKVLRGRKPDYNANNFAINPRFLKLDEKCALWLFPTENSLKQASFLLPSQRGWILRHLYGLLLLPWVYRPVLLWHEVVHQKPHPLNQAKQHPSNQCWSSYALRSLSCSHDCPGGSTRHNGQVWAEISADAGDNPPSSPSRASFASSRMNFPTSALSGSSHCSTNVTWICIASRIVGPNVTTRSWKVFQLG